METSVHHEEDSKDAVMKFFQSREKKKRKNSVFGTYTLMISTVIKIFFYPGRPQNICLYVYV